MINSVLLFLHIGSAALSIGPFFVLLPLINKMRSAEHEVLLTYLEVFRSSVRLVKHAGHVLVATGILLVWQSAWTWAASWLIMTIAVMAGSIFFLARAFTPVIRQFMGGKISQHNLVSKLRRSIWMYILLLLVMLWFMVAKPIIW